MRNYVMEIIAGGCLLLTGGLLVIRDVAITLMSIPVAIVICNATIFFLLLIGRLLGLRLRILLVIIAISLVSIIWFYPTQNVSRGFSDSINAGLRELDRDAQRTKDPETLKGKLYPTLDKANPRKPIDNSIP